MHIARPADTALTGMQPEKIVHAAYEFITGTLLANPQRVGKLLGPPLSPAHSSRRGEYRILLLIGDVTRSVIVTAIKHRAGAY